MAARSEALTALQVYKWMRALFRRSNGWLRGVALMKRELHVRWLP